jgi:hypothetical protein
LRQITIPGNGEVGFTRPGQVGGTAALVPLVLIGLFTALVVACIVTGVILLNAAVFMVGGARAVRDYWRKSGSQPRAKVAPMSNKAEFDPDIRFVRQQRVQQSRSKRSGKR